MTTMTQAYAITAEAVAAEQHPHTEREKRGRETKPVRKPDSEHSQKK